MSEQLLESFEILNKIFSPETSDETALKTFCRYELKVKIRTANLKIILYCSFAMY